MSTENNQSIIIPPNPNNELTLQDLRFKKMQEIDTKVQDIVQLNEYIDCIIKSQDEQIDNVLYRMRMEDVRSRKTIAELNRVLSRKKNRKKILKILGVGFGIVICFFCFGKVLKIVINKIL